jgi:hypothetical protein
MDVSVLALLAGLMALALSGLHCFYRRGPHGSQTWEVVFEPSPKGKEVGEDVMSSEQRGSHDAPASPRHLGEGPGVREAG